MGTRTFRSRPVAVLVSLGLFAFLSFGPPVHAIGVKPAVRVAVPVDPFVYVDLTRTFVKDYRPPEAYEMLRAIVHGSDMGPGQGWFHDGQSRYDWKWLADRFDANKDGKITRDEFRGPRELFDALDRDHDGELSRSDFDWADRGMAAMQRMPANQWFGMMDTNSNGRVSREEWQAYFTRMAKGKDFITADDLRDAFPLAPPKRPAGAKPPPDPSPVTLFLGVLSGELGSVFSGPAIGQRAPDFSLKTQDGSRQYRLSDYRGKKPVVLVFGSFT